MAEPERVFREQVRAFNARDLEAFLATYAPQTELHGLLPDRVVRGHEQMRPLYEARFAQEPLHCEIHALTVFGGRWVAAHEQVLSPAGTVELVGVFEIVDGLIARADMTGRLPLQSPSR